MIEFDSDTAHMLLYPDPYRHKGYSRAYRENGDIRYQEAFHMQTIQHIVSGKAKWHHLTARRIRLWAPRDPDHMRDHIKGYGKTESTYQRLTEDIVATEG